MTTKKNFCIITGTRAEYGLLYPLIKKIAADDTLHLQLIVTGMHLSPEFGLTYQEIEKEFKIDKKIEMLLSSDSPTGISKSMGLAQISFSESFEELNPDVIIVLGDRYEIFSACSAAMIANIPISHISGGETTEGAFDEAIRHSLTKMSHLHFTSTQEYKNRVIQLGEQPHTVFNVGALGVENIKQLSLLNKEQLEESISFKLNKKNILVTFHPVTLESDTSKIQFQEILNTLSQQKDTNIIFTKANSDKHGRIINVMIEKYVKENPNHTIYFNSLGQLRYLSLLQFVDIVLGNSSSGITEAPSFKIATINIGDRQEGRIQAPTVINCNPIKDEIIKAIDKAYSKTFKTILANSQNPYEKAGTSSAILEILKKNFPLNIKKSFYDIKNTFS